MSAETDGVEVFKRFLEKAALEYAKEYSGDDSSLQFFDQVTALFDDYLAHASLTESRAEEGLPWWRRRAKQVLKPLALLTYAAKYGTRPLQNRLTEAFQAGLERQKKIKQGERRTLNIHQVIKFMDDGSCAATLASSEAYISARRALVIVGILTFAGLVLVWTTLSQFAMGVPIAYTLGSLLGWLWRDAYDSAWGRDKLARRLSQELPFLYLTGVRAAWH